MNGARGHARPPLCLPTRAAVRRLIHNNPHDPTVRPFNPPSNTQGRRATRAQSAHPSDRMPTLSSPAHQPSRHEIIHQSTCAPRRAPAPSRHRRRYGLSSRPGQEESERGGKRPHTHTHNVCEAVGRLARARRRMRGTSRAGVASLDRRPGQQLRREAAPLHEGGQHQRADGRALHARGRVQRPALLDEPGPVTSAPSREREGHEVFDADVGSDARQQHYGKLSEASRGAHRKPKTDTAESSRERAPQDRRLRPARPPAPNEFDAGRPILSSKSRAWRCVCASQSEVFAPWYASGLS